LVHRDSESESVINTDAIARAVGGVLMKEDKVGKLRIISTASPVSNPTDQRYCTGEQQLLAAVR